MRSPAVSPPAMTWSLTITAAAGVWLQSFLQRVAMSKSYQVATCSDPSGLAMASCSGRGTGLCEETLTPPWFKTGKFRMHTACRDLVREDFEATHRRRLTPLSDENDGGTLILKVEHLIPPQCKSCAPRGRSHFL